MKTALVFMVAGMSSRFGGKIKQFAKVGPDGETLIEYSINQALDAGFNEIIFIVGEKTEEPFKEMFGTNYNGIPVKYAKQTFNPETRDKPWGTTDALLRAKGIIDSPFVVLNGDDIYGKDAYETIHAAVQNSNVSVGYKLGTVIPEEGSVNRGIFQEENGNVTKIVENIGITKATLAEHNLTENSLASMNFFGLQPEVLSLLEEKLTAFKDTHVEDRKAECLLPTELCALIDEGKISMKLLSTTSQWFGVTNPEDEEIVAKQLKELSI